jgi:surface polysaccharide O-acyltransferase-like enzyme
MLKLIGIIVAAMPVILFVRAMFMGSKRRAQAVSNFRKELDYAVWVILLMIGLVLVLSIGKLILDLGIVAPR